MRTGRGGEVSEDQDPGEDLEDWDPGEVLERPRSWRVQKDKRQLFCFRRGATVVLACRSFERTRETIKAVR